VTFRLCLLDSRESLRPSLCVMHPDEGHDEFHQQLRQANHLAQESLETAQLNSMSAQYADMWGLGLGSY
jgi:hypothetical protein